MHIFEARKKFILSMSCEITNVDVASSLALTLDRYDLADLDSLHLLVRVVNYS